MSLFKRPWNLRLAHRVLIAACALVYLLLYRPWSGTAPGGPANYYAAAAGMLILAALPPRFRLVTAVALAVAAMLAIMLGWQLLGA